MATKEPTSNIVNICLHIVYIYYCTYSVITFTIVNVPALTTMYCNSPSRSLAL
jgi:hypothetical protein